MTIAQTILSQLGGNRFCAMTGAKDINSTSNALHFKFGKGAKNKANHCSITLQTNDTYIIEFHQVGAASVRHIGVFYDIYANGLEAIFKNETGLDTRL